MTNGMTADLRVVETTWDPTSSDLRRAVVLVLGTAKYYAIGSAFLALGVLATVLGIETTSDGFSIPLFWLPVGVFSAVTFALLPHFVGWQLWASNHLVRLRQHARLDATGVTSSTELVMTRLAWAALPVAYEADHFFLLATRSGSGASFVQIPKDDLSHDELVTARTLILENVGQIR